jgi:hypothetical protein
LPRERFDDERRAWEPATAREAIYASSLSDLGWRVG